MSSIKAWLRDVLASGKSKRVLAATVTTFVVVGGQEWFGLDEATTTKVAALAIALIVGDSMRSVSGKETTTEVGSNGET